MLFFVLASVLASAAFNQTQQVFGKEMEDGRIRVHIDLDATMTSFVGLDVDDDIAALFLVGSMDKVVVTGLSATHGNGPMWSTCPGAQRLAEVMGFDASKVACGTGYGSDFKKAGNPAAKVIGEAMDRGETILALGALTNVAAAIHEDPRRGAQSTVVAMGGILKAGGLELNFWADHKAANYVTEVFAGDVVAVTRETCLSGKTITSEDMAELDQCLPKTSFLKGWVPRLRRHAVESTIRRIEYFGHEVAASLGEGFVPWDVVTAAAISDPELFEEGFECRLMCDADNCDADAANVPLGPVVELEEGERCRRIGSAGSPARLLVPPTVNSKRMRKTIIERLCASQTDSAGFSAPIDAIYEQFDRLRMIPLSTGIPLPTLIFWLVWAPTVLKSVFAAVAAVVLFVLDSKRQAEEMPARPVLKNTPSERVLFLGRNVSADLSLGHTVSADLSLGHTLSMPLF